MSFTGEPIQDFHSRREKELFEHRFSVRAAATRKQIRALIDQSEKEEEINRSVIQEMDDFFKDTTRSAARIFGTIEEEQAHFIEKRVAQEMEEFMVATRRKVETLLRAYRNEELETGEVENQLSHLLETSRDPLEDFATHVAQEMDPED